MTDSPYLRCVRLHVQPVFFLNKRLPVQTEKKGFFKRYNF